MEDRVWYIEGKPVKIVDLSNEQLQKITAWLVSAASKSRPRPPWLLDALLAEMKKRDVEPTHGYLVQVCCLCDKKALYRVGSKGYCKDHQKSAMQQRAVATVKLNTLAEEKTAHYAKIEHERKRSDQLRKLHRNLMGKLGR